MSATNSFQRNYEQFILDNTPFSNQTEKHLLWLNKLLEPIQRLNDLKFTDYYYGTSYSFFTSSATYSIGDRVNGNLEYDNAVYEAVNDLNVGGTFSLTDWIKVLPMHIGFEERLKYTDSRVVFEWALNRFFRTEFRQPNFADTSKSDIYISDNDPSSSSFLVGPDDFSSDFVGRLDSVRAGNLIENVWVGPDPTIYPDTNTTFTIWISATAYSTFPGYTGLSYSGDSSVRKFADVINYSGMPYNIKTY